MSPAEAEQRAHVVRAARRWTATPYKPMGDVLGAGVDCGMSLVRWFVDSGLIAPFDPRPYPPDFMLHRDDERYLGIVRSLAAHEYDPRERPPPAGDLVVWRHGRSFSHGALVTGKPGTLSGWPWVIHAYAGARMVEEIDTTGTPLMVMGDGSPRPIRAFSYWPEPA